MNESVDLRTGNSIVKDQGRRGTCVACATTAAHELIRNEDVRLCIEFLHWASKRRDGLPKSAQGTTLSAANDALVHEGQPPEAAWPYSDARDQWAHDYQPPQRAVDEAQQRRLMGGEALVPSAVAIRNALNGGRLVVFGIRLHGTWYTVGADGQIDMPTTRSIDFGGHAALVLGYRGSDFIIQNSWGPIGATMGSHTSQETTWIAMALRLGRWARASLRRSNGDGTLCEHID